MTTPFLEDVNTAMPGETSLVRQRRHNLTPDNNYESEKNLRAQ